MRKNQTDISFKDFIRISEGKQVGVLYHFTRLSSLLDMIKFEFDLSSHQEYVSFTRNYNMIDYDKYKNDLSFDYSKGDKRIVRIAIDGDKLSNKYKIEPFQDLEHRVERNSGEAEERILNKIVSISCCIKQIDIISKNSRDGIKASIREAGYTGKLKFADNLNKLKKVKND